MTRATTLILIPLIALALTGCTQVVYQNPNGAKLTYTNAVFEKQLSKASLNPDGSFSIEGVKNTTPEIVGAAIDAAIKAAK